MTDHSTSPKPADRIAAAGRSLFFERGFHAVTTDDLAAAAGVSKATLYKYFGNMTDVLRTVVRNESDTFTDGVSANTNDVEELGRALSRYGENLLTFLNSDDAIRFSQLMHEGARQDADAASEFFDAAYGRSRQTVAAIMKDAAIKGMITERSTPAELADQFLGMLEGFAFVQAQLGLADVPYPHPRARARKCVETFLNGITA